MPPCKGHWSTLPQSDFQAQTNLLRIFIPTLEKSQPTNKPKIKIRVKNQKIVQHLQINSSKSKHAQSTKRITKKTHLARENIIEIVSNFVQKPFLKLVLEIPKTPFRKSSFKQLSKFET